MGRFPWDGTWHTEGVISLRSTVCTWQEFRGSGCMACFPAGLPCLQGDFQREGLILPHENLYCLSDSFFEKIRMTSYVQPGWFKPFPGLLGWVVSRPVVSWAGSSLRGVADSPGQNIFAKAGEQRACQLAP